MDGGAMDTDMMGGGLEINDLMSTNKCSPMVVYGVMAAISLFSIYSSKNTINRYNGKYDSLMSYYMMNEIKMLIIIGASVYGLCVYKERQLPWILLMIFIIYKLIKNLIIYAPLPNILSNAPVNYVSSGSANYGITPQMQQALLQQSAKQNINKQLDLNGIEGGGLADNMAPPLDSGGFSKF